MTKRVAPEATGIIANRPTTLANTWQQTSTLQEKAQKEARLLKLKIRPFWYDTPAGDDGKPDHNLLEKLLKLAIAVARRQVVFD